SVGGFPSATSTGSDLQAIAKGSGISRTSLALDLESFIRQFDEALHTDELSSIVAKVEAVGPAGFVTELSLLENRFQFKRWMREKSSDIAHAFV
ncbi:MAG: hypothetical protein O7G85_08055, partial [Planctomycetota bacterium]|nr:hypothetical protein [Planctomycetota bacterium]